MRVEMIIEKYSSEIVVLMLVAMVLGTLLVLIPQILRAHHRTREMQHEEYMRALEHGQRLPPLDERSRAAGRTASLVPMVVVCAAAIVTCFLVSFKSDHLFAVSLTVWCVTGVVSLAAITGGVALVGRLAQLSSGDEDFETEEKGQ